MAVDPLATHFSTRASAVLSSDLLGPETAADATQRPPQRPPNPKFYQPPHPAATYPIHASFHSLPPSKMAQRKYLSPSATPGQRFCRGVPSGRPCTISTRPRISFALFFSPTAHQSPRYLHNSLRAPPRTLRLCVISFLLLLLVADTVSPSGYLSPSPRI